VKFRPNRFFHIFTSPKLPQVCISVWGFPFLSSVKMMPAGTTNSVVPFGRRTRSAWTERDLVRVATFNIYNINKRLDNLLAWLAKAEPDVVSLQELKAEQGAFPVNALRALGYEAVWQGERSWNGVAILARNHAPVLTCASLPGNPSPLHRSGCSGSSDHFHLRPQWESAAWTEIQLQVGLV
jgi:endonuclease/exonuclease/phosphatase (EEP) superfamily protein YafD